MQLGIHVLFHHSFLVARPTLEDITTTAGTTYELDFYSIAWSLDSVRHIASNVQASKGAWPLLGSLRMPF